MWQPMETAPRDTTNILAKLEDGKIVVAHWAEGGGEEQPPFKGWFNRVGGDNGYFSEVTPVGWQQLNPFKLEMTVE